MIVSKLATIMLWGIAMGITSGIGVLMLIQYMKQFDRRKSLPDGALMVPMCLLGAALLTGFVGLLLIFTYAKELAL